MSFCELRVLLFNANLTSGPLDISFTSQYIGKQTLGAWNLQHQEQNRPPTDADAFPFKYYPDVFIHDVQVGVKVDGGKFRFYVGVDNVTDQLPPYGVTGVTRPFRKAPSRAGCARQSRSVPRGCWIPRRWRSRR